MPAEDLKAMIQDGVPVQIYCHMCGKGYRVEIDRLQAILQARH